MWLEAIQNATEEEQLEQQRRAARRLTEEEQREQQRRVARSLGSVPPPSLPAMEWAGRCFDTIQNRHDFNKSTTIAHKHGWICRPPNFCFALATAPFAL